MRTLLWVWSVCIYRHIVNDDQSTRRQFNDPNFIKDVNSASLLLSARYSTIRHTKHIDVILFEAFTFIYVKRTQYWGSEMVTFKSYEIKVNVGIAIIWSQCSFHLFHPESEFLTLHVSLFSILIVITAPTTKQTMITGWLHYSAKVYVTQFWYDYCCNCEQHVLSLHSIWVNLLIYINVKIICRTEYQKPIIRVSNFF